MDILSLVMPALLLVILVLLALLFFRLNRSDTKDEAIRLEASIQVLKAELIGKQAESLVALRESIDSANRIINERLAEGTSALDRRMSVFGEIENKLGQLSMQTANIETIGKNIQSLSELLRPPKLRGNLGEMLLENLLAQILPRSLFETQYKFADGRRVDAVIRLGDRLLPVDAKFPLESYERLTAQPDDRAAQKEFSQSFKKHVDAIASKYLKRDEQTTDFAVMYIPSEAVYYQLISQDDRTGFEHAISKNVIPSSPGHLYGFLASTAAIYSEISLAQVSLTRGSRWLAAGINELSETSNRLDRLHERMGSSLRTLSANFEKAKVELQEIRYQLEKLREPAGSVGKERDEKTLDV